MSCVNALRAIEAKVQNAFSPVIVGRPIEGISLNDLEWLLDENGNEMVFKNRLEAEAFLLKNGFNQEDLEWFIFLEVENEDRN